jgi:hypothetical protein
MTLAHAGEHRKAWSLVQALRPSLAKRPADYQFHLAAVSSVCLGAAEKDSALSAEDRAKRCASYEAAGVEFLAQAFARVSEPDRSKWLSAELADPDLAPLRRRADFQAIAGQAKPGAAAR